MNHPKSRHTDTAAEAEKTETEKVRERTSALSAAYLRYCTRVRYCPSNSRVMLQPHILQPHSRGMLQDHNV